MHTQKTRWKMSSSKILLSCKTAGSTESRRSKGNFNKQGALLAGIRVIILLKQSNICIICASGEWKGTLCCLILFGSIMKLKG